MIEADKLHSVYTDRVFVVTSCVDGQHKDHSRHYTGNAFDMRTWYFASDKDTKDYVDDLRVILGADYDVVLESNHIHVEFDPER